MKIVSRVPKDKVLVMLSEDELANIMGHYSSYSKITDSESFHQYIEKAIKEERTIEVSDIYKKFDSIQRLLTSSSYDKVRAKLENMLTILTPIEDKVVRLGEITKELE